MALTHRENYLRTASLDPDGPPPDHIPITVAISGASWDQLRTDLEDVLARHPILFPNFEKGTRDYTKRDFGPASTIACYYGWVQELIGEMTGWVADHGVDPDTARLLVAQMTRAAATTVRDRPDESIRALVDELATPRSFTLKGLEVLREADAVTPWKNAAAALFEKG